MKLSFDVTLREESVSAETKKVIIEKAKEAVKELDVEPIKNAIKKKLFDRIEDIVEDLVAEMLDEEDELWQVFKKFAYTAIMKKWNSGNS